MISLIAVSAEARFLRRRALVTRNQGGRRSGRRGPGARRCKVNLGSIALSLSKAV
jgi:hypothetical protein